MLVLASQTLGAPPPAQGQAAAADAKATALKERDRLWQQTQELRAAGKLAEAIAAAEAMLAIERKVLPENHADLAVSLNWLADLTMEREDFAAAKAARQEALEIRRKRHGSNHWKVTDARLALEDVNRRAGLTVEQRLRLAAARRIDQQVAALQKTGKFREAEAQARQALAIREEVLGQLHPESINNLNHLAYLLLLQKDHAAARPLYERTLDLRKRVLGERHPDYAQSLTNLMFVNWLLRDYAAARTVWQEKLDYEKAVHGEHHADYATTLILMARILCKLDDHAKARGCIEQAMSIRKEILGDRHPGYAETLQQLAEWFELQGKYDAARPFYERALAIFKESRGEHDQEYLDCLNGLAGLLRTQGDYDAAKPLLEKVLAFRKDTLGEHHSKYAAALNELALLLWEQGQNDAAEPLFEKALAVQKDTEGEHSPDYASMLNNLGLIYFSRANYSAARPLVERAMALRKEILGEHHSDYIGSLSNLASLREAQGDYAAARPLMEEVVALTKQTLGEHHLFYGGALCALGRLSSELADYGASRAHLEKALTIAESFGKRHPLYATCLSNLGELHRLQGNLDEARSFFERTLTVTREIHGERHPSYAIGLDNLSVVLQSLGQIDEAVRLSDQAAKICKETCGEWHPDYAKCLSNLGVLNWRSGDLGKALALLEHSLEIFRRNIESTSVSQSEREQLAMASRELRWTLDSYLSLAIQSKVTPEAAYRHVLDHKGAIFETQRRLRDLRRLLRADPRPEVRRDAAEWQSIVVRLATKALAQPDPKQQDAWRRKLAELTERKEQLEEELTRQSAAFRAARAAAQRTPEQLQAALPRDAALIDVLEYTHVSPPPERKGEPKFEDRLVAFVVRPDRPIARVELGRMEPIHAAIDAWRPILRREQPAPQDEQNGPAARLRRLVWSPLDEHLAGVATVLVSPDGALGLVPLEALPGKAAGSYLIEDYTLALVPVPRMFGADGAVAAEGPKPATAHAEAPSLLLVGDIDYGGDPGVGADRGASRAAAVGTRAGLLPDFPKLPATGDEIAAIGRYFKHHFRGAQSDELSGEVATEAALREAASTHRFLHLATHGYFAPPELRSALGSSDAAARPGTDLFGARGVAGFHPGLLSGLALAGANVRPTPLGKDDGILTALEVAELDLAKVELAVLSACETGLGEVAGGEGLLGLQRAFQVAGARAVVASLWKVPDIPTQNLMSRFYENLWRKGLPPRAALRAAQLEMLREGYQRGLVPIDEPRKTERVPPFYWAAFVLSTDRL